MNNFGKPIAVDEDYVKPKVNLFEIMNSSNKGVLPPVNLLVPIFQWKSNTRDNIQSMQFINEHFFFTNKDILNRFMILNQKIHYFIKYPKAKKIEHKHAWLLPFIQKFFDWSCSDLKYNMEFVDLDDKELHVSIASRFGFDKKFRRKLGLKAFSPKIEKFRAKPDRQQRF